MSHRMWSDWTSYQWASKRTPRRRLLGGAVALAQFAVGIWLYFAVGHGYAYGFVVAVVLLDAAVGRHWLTQDGTRLLGDGAA